MKRDTTQIVDCCLADIRSGKSTLEQCLARYPDRAPELRPLLEIALRIKSDGVGVSPQFKQQARQRLWLEMDRPSPRLSVITSLFFTALRPFHSLRTLSVLLSAVAILSFGGVLQAARASLPDDSLYGLKTGLENLRLAATLDPVKKSELRIDLVQSRIEEVLQMNRLGRPVSRETLNYISICLQDALYEDVPASSQAHSELLERFSQVANNQLVKLENDADADGDDGSPAIKQVYESTQLSLDLVTLARNDPEVLHAKIPLDSSEAANAQFDLTGQLKIDGEGNWNIDGAQLKNVHIGHNSPPAEGAAVTIKGITLGDSTYITHIDPVDDSQAESDLGEQEENGESRPEGPQKPVVTVAGSADAMSKKGVESESVEVSPASGTADVKPRPPAQTETKSDDNSGLISENNPSDQKSQNGAPAKSPEKSVSGSGPQKTDTAQVPDNSGSSKNNEAAKKNASGDPGSPQSTAGSSNTQPADVKDNSSKNPSSQNQNGSHSQPSSGHEPED